jgi:hypothetical protein
MFPIFRRLDDFVEKVVPRAAAAKHLQAQYEDRRCRGDLAQRRQTGSRDTHQRSARPAAIPKTTPVLCQASAGVPQLSVARAIARADDRAHPSRSRLPPAIEPHSTPKMREAKVGRIALVVRTFNKSIQ